LQEPASELPKPRTVLETASTTTPNVLTQQPLSPQQRHREVIFTKRVASCDLRIGLNLLGENGRMLLAEYIKSKCS
jgi:hypothetical protein